MSETKDANNGNRSPSLTPAAESPGYRQTIQDARTKSFLPSASGMTTASARQGMSFQPQWVDGILMTEEVAEEVDDIAKQQLIKETIDTYKEDFLNERCERKLLMEEVNSLRQQVRLLLFELSTARHQVVSQSEELNRLQKQMNALSYVPEHSVKNTVDTEVEKRRRFGATSSLPSEGFQSTWRCRICTYENPRQRLSSCEMCGYIRFKENETPKTRLSMASTGELEPDQVKTRRRKCGKPVEYQWISAAHTQRKPKSQKYRRTMDIPGQVFFVHA